MNRAAPGQHSVWADVISVDPYGPLYEKFLFNYLTSRDGYDFHHPAVLQPVPPPTVTFSRPLWWWSLDRPHRLAAIRRLRDALIQAILALGDRPADLEPVTPSASKGSQPRAVNNTPCPLPGRLGFDGMPS